MKRNFIYTSVLAGMNIFLMIKAEVLNPHVMTIFICCMIIFLATTYMGTVGRGKKMWLARNKSSRLVLYREKPIKLEDKGVWVISDGDYSSNTCDLGLWEEYLPEGCDPKWEDSEPIEVKIITA